jgi:hypothetical protein
MRLADFLPDRDDDAGRKVARILGDDHSSAGQLPEYPVVLPCGVGGNPQTSYWANKISILTTMTQGTLGFFSARPFPPINSPAADPSQVSYYDSVRSTGQCNTVCSLSAGVWKPKVFRGR